MDHELLGLAFAAGLVAALNPCGFALLPAYLTFVITDASPGRPVAVARAAAVTVAMTAGFLTVFAGFGVLTVPVAGAVQRYLPFVTVIVGVTLVAVGLWLLAGYRLHMPMPPPERWTPTTRLGSMFGYGIAYAVASLSCTVGPFLAVTAAGARSGSALDAVAVYLVYAGGFALIVGTLAIGAAFACSAVAARLRRLLPIANRVGGALVILVGLYVGYYGAYELRLFTVGGNPRDAVIAAAGRVQGTMAGWVHGHGGVPWILLLMALICAAAVWAWRLRNDLARIRCRRSRSTSD